MEDYKTVYVPAKALLDKIGPSLRIRIDREFAAYVVGKERVMKGEFLKKNFPKLHDQVWSLAERSFPTKAPASFSTKSYALVCWAFQSLNPVQLAVG